MSGKRETQLSANNLFTSLKDVNENPQKYLWDDHKKISIL